MQSVKFHALTGESKAARTPPKQLPTGWEGYENTQLETTGLLLPKKPAVLSDKWEKLRAAFCCASGNYRRARSQVAAVRSLRERNVTLVRRQLQAFLGEDALTSIAETKGTSPGDAKAVRDFLDARAARTMSNERLRMSVSAFHDARERYQNALRHKFDELYRKDDTPVPERHVNMVLYFLLEDSFKDPTVAAQVRQKASARVASLNRTVAAEQQAQVQANAVNLVRTEVLSAARATAQLTARGEPPTVRQLTCAMQDTLTKKGLDPRFVDVPEPGAAGVEEGGPEGVAHRARTVRTARREEPIDADAAMAYGEERLELHMGFQNLREESKRVVRTTFGRMLGASLSPRDRSIVPSRVDALARQAAKEYGHSAVRALQFPEGQVQAE